MGESGACIIYLRLTLFPKGKVAGLIRSIQKSGSNLGSLFNDGVNQILLVFVVTELPLQSPAFD